ncbi:hypothetical protein [Micromonospora sp. NPDC049497]|uniref:hypothetical protein n=1 Tax=Micromonospora sp. NPDC049497 TaxID=3364273 RepID=UPI00378AF04E
MISWTSPGAGGQPPTAPGPLTVRALDPLPPRVAVPAPQPRRPLPRVAAAVVVVVLVAGSPWGYEAITEWRYGLPSADGLGAVLTSLVEMMIFGLTWLRWQARITDDGGGYWLVENAKVLVFVLATVWLLRRLAAAGPAPSRTYRVLATLGAPLAGAAAATAVAVLLLKLLVSDAALDSSGYLRSLLAGGMYAGAVLGAPLALVAALRPTTSTGGDAPTIGDRT